MRVLVCGDRHWLDTDKIYDRLDKLPKEGLIIIEGEATGADTIARLWAESRSIPFLPFPALWGKYGRAAGPVRNKQMLVEGKPDLVIAFHEHIGQSKGTLDMVTQSKKAGVSIEVINGIS